MVLRQRFIGADHELPAHYAEWKEFNLSLTAAGSVIDKKEDALPGAKSLEQIKASEIAAGWTPVEPQNAP